MLSITDSTLRRRLAAGAIAFAVVSGASLASAVPAFAATTPVDETPVATTPAADDTTAETPIAETPDAETADVAVAEPTLTASQTTLTVSEMNAGALTITASGYEPGTEVRITLQYPSHTVWLDFMTADANGQLVYTFVPAEGTSYRAEVFDIVVYSGSVQTNPVRITVVDDDDDTTDEGATATATQSTFAPGDAVTYVGAGFQAGAEASITVAGPVSGSFTEQVGDDGTVAGEITYNETDAVTGEVIRRLDWPVGTYSVTIDDGVNSVTFEFIIVGADGQTPAPSATETPRGEAPSTGSKPDELVQTGAEDVFGIAGLGLLLAGAGAAALVLRRRSARSDA